MRIEIINLELGNQSLSNIRKVKERCYYWLTTQSKDLINASSLTIFHSNVQDM